MTCGSGSLLLKVAYEATTKVTLYGQEEESTTAGLARIEDWYNEVRPHSSMGGATLIREDLIRAGNREHSGPG